MPPDLIDPDDGENRAVRSFLLAYGTHGLTVGMMRTNMRLSGWDGLWPEWVNTQPETAHLTKGGAQHWLRHLFSLETAAGVREHCPTCGADEPYTGACGTSKDDTRALCRRSTPGVKGAPLVHIPKDSRAGKPPCGECHLQPGETCDICGSTNGVPVAHPTDGERDLAALCVRLVRRLREVSPDDKLGATATDYLNQRRYLNPLRIKAMGPAPADGVKGDGNAQR